MKELSPEELVSRCNEVREMTQNATGWKHVKAEIDEMRQEAFKDWATLRLDAPPNEVLMVRAKETVLKDLLSRIEDMVKLGDEAREKTERGESGQKSVKGFLNETDLNTEIERLKRPLPWYKQIFGITSKEAPEKIEAR